MIIVSACESNILSNQPPGQANNDKLIIIEFFMAEGGKASGH